MQLNSGTPSRNAHANALIRAVNDIISMQKSRTFSAGPNIAEDTENQIPSTICLVSSRDLLVGILAVVQQKFGADAGQFHATTVGGESRTFRFGPLIAALRRLNEQLVARHSKKLTDASRVSPLNVLSIDGPVCWDSAVDKIDGDNPWISMHIEQSNCA